MSSILEITSVEKLQNRINSTVKSIGDDSTIYVSLNKTQKSVEQILKTQGIDTSKIFFIDCITSERTRDDVMHIPPTDLEKLRFAIDSFIKEIPGKKFLIIDALSTLLIYNSENKVAAFIKSVTEFACKNDIHVIAFSPKTKGEELLGKIFNFFDKVNK